MPSKYRRLVVWQRAMQLVLAVYDASRAFPAEEKFGLQSQIRRAAVSVPSNIAEGDGRGGKQDQRRFLLTARGSLMEVETQILIAEALGYVSAEQSASLLDSIERTARPLNGLIAQLGT